MVAKPWRRREGREEIKEMAKSRTISFRQTGCNCADYDLLSNSARRQWGFQGYIVSDCDAVSIIHDVQKYAKSQEDAVADVLKAGMDVNCGSYLKNYTKSAVEQKKLSISDIHRALHNLFSVRMRLGLFNGNPRNLLFGNIGANQVCTKEHQDLALEAARSGIVLLKNSNKLLPQKKDEYALPLHHRPHANVPQTLLGNYEGPPLNCSTADVEKAVEVAKKADYVVLVMGLDEYQDRDDLLLPAMQQSLIQRVARAAKRPVVLVLLCGDRSMFRSPKGNPKIGGILWVGYPGESGGWDCSC
ncbi:glycosyl hydrolase family protein [Actinidia rufa]|uniref:Glycosyl hydrolase family protein n=1 Tax=Actinidia rufa TaxID=165716 RepID=A0A7J0FCK4_9ERIC|nr:glycosyl hydrolase family protein [Actinidia rufa]